MALPVKGPDDLVPDTEQPYMDFEPSRRVGPKIAASEKTERPSDFFLLYFGQALVLQLVAFTNIKGKSESEKVKNTLITNLLLLKIVVTWFQVSTCTETGLSKFLWKPLQSVAGMYRYFAGLLMMGIIRLPAIKDYWSHDLGHVFIPERPWAEP